MFRRVVKKAVAGAAAAAAAFVAVGALGFTLFYALRLVVVPVAAAAITFAVFAVAAAVIASVFLKDPDGSTDDDEDEEPHSLASRAVHLIRERPILGAVGGLGALFLLLRNPAMAAIAASMITERRMERKGYRRR